MEKIGQTLHFSSMGKKGESAPGRSAMSERMRVLRRVIEGDDHGALTRFATRLAVGVPRWHNVENGMHVSFALADILVRKIPGLTLDWIYYGKTEGLTMALADRLDKSEDTTSAVN